MKTTTEGLSGKEARDRSVARLLTAATFASVGVALTLVVAKTVAWFMTGSVAILSTLIDSIIDTGASLLTLLAVRASLAPADENHRFGHGKAEPLAGLGQAAFISGSAVFLVIHGIERVLVPEPVHGNMVGIVVMVLSTVLTLGLVAFQKYVIRRTGSLAVGGDSLHYTGDLLMNVSVIGSLVIGLYFDIPLMDPILGIVIALFLMVSAWEIGHMSINMLMDRELPEDERRRILDICFDDSRVLDVHDLRTRRSGQTTFIQLHLDLDGNLSLTQAHDITSDLYRRLAALFPQSEILIHQDPIGEDDDEHHPTFAYSDSRMPPEPQ
ncbi:cation diffusion facilitator family transporter [Phaeovibrio sulfidiphilus]|uniref:Protein p34 n=1 Tax=Phaeovibrio sulfidiphilus TaxID=1220600 RepID=A0A8J6YPJ4_9PROT|nr:cation diffusion facilitator family transporter [Phaeovibrio sulfidiphilus]MBE1237271.1 cation diffusion facilitator family transporter [Phaeovibrio sulfidiphilus]